MFPFFGQSILYRNKKCISKNPYIWHAIVDQGVDELMIFLAYFINFIQLFPLLGHWHFI